MMIRTKLNFIKNQNGFSLLELLIVVAVLGILVTVAVPALMRSRVNANESSTKSNLQTFTSSMESYRANQQPPVYPTDIGGLTTATPAYLDSTWGTSTSATKSGYTLTYVRTDGARYILTGEPTLAGNTGNNSYCVDETGVLWTSATSSGAFTASPCSGGTGAAIMQ